MECFSEQFDAIGVSNQVTVVDQGALAVALSIARREVQAIDDSCSRFRDDSELARLNRDGAVEASPLFLEALRAAIRAAETTDGLVDPTVGSAMRALGYDRDFDVIVRHGARARFELRPAVGWKALRISDLTGRVTLVRGAELDLGATAKAFAADRIANLVYSSVGSPVLVSLGGDVAVAGASPPGGWPILVTDDSRAAHARGQVVGMGAGGLATSSTTVRRWRAGQVEMHHIVDPRTGASADSCWRTVSVAARTCLEANVAATAAVLLGSQAPGWLGGRGLSARLVTSDGRTESTGAWPTESAPAGDSRDQETTAEVLSS